MSLTSLIERGSSTAMAIRRRKDPDQVYREVMASFDVETRARVQAFIISLGLDTHDPFFLFALASGYLVALVEKAPENWRALFDNFKQELEEWTTQNLRTLEAINQQSQSVEHLAISFQELSNLTISSNEETQELQIVLNQLIAVLKRHNGELSQILSQTRDSNQALETRFSTTEKVIISLESRRTWIWGINYGLMVGLIGGLIWLSWQQVQQSERVGWLLEKANRQECATGVKPADDPQCRQFQ